VAGTLWDGIVVGAGPAGAVIAYLLARRGLNILVLEKARLPRYKTCGGGVTLKTVQNLPFDASPTFECQAVGGILSYAGRQLLKVDLGWTIAWTVMRERFDYFLIQQALQAGAWLEEGVTVEGVVQLLDRVVVHTSHGDYFSRYVAGADGVNSVVAHSLGMLPGRQAGVAVEAEVAVSPNSLRQQAAYATFDFGVIPYGYGWIFPKQDHLSVGIFQARPGKAIGLRKRLDQFIACQPVLEGGNILHIQGHQIPLGGSHAPLHQGRVLLLGDAANLADPWLGEGLYYAVLSARLAAPVMTAALENPIQDLSAYSELIHSTVSPQLSYARLFSAIVYHFPHLCSNLLSRSPVMQQSVFSALRGDRTFKQMSKALLLGLPRILIEAI
jgi:geranylgeranyl reductase family protein